MQEKEEHIPKKNFKIRIIAIVGLALLLAGGGYYFVKVKDISSLEHKTNKNEEKDAHQESEKEVAYRIRNPIYKDFGDYYIVVASDEQECTSKDENFCLDSSKRRTFQIFNKDLEKIYDSKEDGIYIEKDDDYSYSKTSAKEYIISKFTSGKLELYKFEKGKLKSIYVKDFGPECSPTLERYVKQEADGEKYTVALRILVFNKTTRKYQRYTYLIEENKEVPTADVYIQGDHKRLGEGEDIVFANDQEYVITANHFSGTSDDRYGLYDFKQNQYIIENKYEQLAYAFGDYYVAQKDGKAGIIDSSERVIMDFEYDYIAPFDGYFIAGKSGKLAVINQNLEFITDFVFDGPNTYNYYPCCGDLAEFESHMKDGKILIITNTNYHDGNKPPSSTYLINPDGSFKIYQDYVYDRSNPSTGLLIGDMALFDFDLNKIYDFSTLGLESFPNTYILGNNCYFIHNQKLYIFDLKTGKSLDELTYKDITIQCTFSKKIKDEDYFNISYYSQGKLIYTIHDKDFKYTGLMRETGENQYILADSTILEK